MPTEVDLKVNNMDWCGDHCQTDEIKLVDMKFLKVFNI